MGTGNDCPGQATPWSRARITRGAFWNTAAGLGLHHLKEWIFTIPFNNPQPPASDRQSAFIPSQFPFCIPSHSYFRHGLLKIPYPWGIVSRFPCWAVIFLQSLCPSDILSILSEAAPTRVILRFQTDTTDEAADWPECWSTNLVSLLLLPYSLKRTQRCVCFVFMVCLAM